jgi:hypothetical protein
MSRRVGTVAVAEQSRRHDHQWRVNEPICNALSARDLHVGFLIQVSHRVGAFPVVSLGASR